MMSRSIKSVQVPARCFGLLLGDSCSSAVHLFTFWQARPEQQLPLPLQRWGLQSELGSQLHNVLQAQCSAAGARSARLLLG